MTLPSSPAIMRPLAWSLMFVCISGAAAADLQVRDTQHAPLATSTLHGYIGTISLPEDGLWRIRAPRDEAAIRELYLMPTQPARLRQLGNRMYAALEERQIQSGQWHVQMGFEACRQYAQDNNGVGPKAIAAFEDEKAFQYIARRWNAPSWRTDELAPYLDEPDRGPFVHLVPNAKFRFSEPLPGARGRKFVSKENREVLAYSLRPFVNDGKHWVLYTDGKCERVQISPQVAKQTAIRPMVKKAPSPAIDRPELLYQIVLVSKAPLEKSLSVVAYNEVLDDRREIQWKLATATEGSYEKCRPTISEARKFAWGPYSMATDGGVLHVWNQSGQREAANPRRSLSMFSVLGGRAAIEETLQLQDLAVTSDRQGTSVSIDSLQGVKVKSHPFEEMLGDDPGGSLELASYVPPERFFLYVGKPESLSGLLDAGAPFIASLGSSVTGNSLQYNLEARYLARLGMTRDWVDAVLESGLTSEMALFAPDLFFIDGTDITVIAKLNQPQLLRQLLGLLGAAKLDAESVLKLPIADGGSAYLALKGNLLFISTHRGELQQAIELLERQGEGSLGASAEFRYMLTQLPVNQETRLYAYFSDPFVRRLVGPQVKIGQRRRMVAKAKMEALTARAMLARLDGHPEPTSVSALTDSRHLPQGWQAEKTSIDAAGLVSSERYGTLPRMRTLPEIPLDEATPEEAEAYRRYVENYSRYWRQFFDPIAIRLDEVGDDQLELSTFILPLVDSSIYNGLRDTMMHQDDGAPLSVPIVEPAPVLQFSANLNDKAWQQVAGDFADFFTRYSGASPAMLDDFGPGVHVAIFDADPIIAMGSGDIFGAFGGDLMRGGGNQMLMIPVALSMLTRPCSIMVETKSPERTSRYLRQAAQTDLRPRNQRRDFAVSFYQVKDRDEWTWTMDIFGVVKLRYGIEVVGKYLVIRNIPWSSEDRVVSVAPAELNAAMLQVNPAACRKQLPGLFAAASDGNRRAVMSGLGRLYPFMLSGAQSVDHAATEHQRLYGFFPRILGDDQWRWVDQRLVSDDYGEPTRQRQPAFDPKKPFGLMNRIDWLKLNMQFEQDGLRSTVRWRLR